MSLRVAAAAAEDMSLRVAAAAAEDAALGQKDTPADDLRLHIACHEGALSCVDELLLQGTFDVNFPAVCQFAGRFNKKVRSPIPHLRRARATYRHSTLPVCRRRE